MVSLALGTVQFGLPYGITNKNGQVAAVEASRTLSFAKTIHVRTLDTAIAYGVSEQILGDYGIHEFDVVTKLPALPAGVNEIEKWVETSVLSSLDRLKLKSLYGLLLHQPRDLFGKNGQSLVRALERLSDGGVVGKLGVSVYDPCELNTITSVMDLGIVQAPLNVLDRRLEMSGWLSRLNRLGVEVHVRSVFLQGLLLSPRDEVPAKFDTWADLWDRWSQFAGPNVCSRMLSCFAYPLSLRGLDQIVVGVECASQLKDIYEAFVKCSESSVEIFPLDDSDVSNLIDPSKWGSL